MRNFLGAMVIVTLAVACSAQDVQNIVPASFVQDQRLFDKPQDHRFFDKKNLILHSWNAAAETLDAVTTRHGLNGRPINELNPFGRVFVNRGWGGQATFSYGFGVGGPLLVSYLLHRSGHHRLERWVPAVNAAGSTAAGPWNLMH